MHNSPAIANNAQLIVDFIKKLGFDETAAKIYLALVQKGPQTLLGASRTSGIERTRLYRKIDALIEQGLIEHIPSHTKRTVQATGLNTLSMLVKEKERQDKMLIESLPFLTNAFNVVAQKSDENQVIYYRGIEGIRTMTWHTLDCIGTYRTYSYRFWDDILGSRFVSRFNAEMLMRHLKVHDIYSDQYFDFKKWWYATGHKHPSGDWSFWQSRFLSEKIVKVDWNMDVYNDVVAYYYWQGEETFGVEIHNARFALFQKQIHDVLWSQARKMPKIDWQTKNQGVYNPTL